MACGVGFGHHFPKNQQEGRHQNSLNAHRQPRVIGEVENQGCHIGRKQNQRQVEEVIQHEEGREELLGVFQGRPIRVRPRGCSLVQRRFVFRGQGEKGHFGSRSDARAHQEQPHHRNRT